MNIKKIILAFIILHLSASSAYAMTSTDTNGTDKNFLPMSNLHSQILDIERVTADTQTPNQKNKAELSYSGSAKLQTEKTTNNNFIIAIHNKKLVTSFSEGILRKPKNQEEIYKDQQNVSKKFLDKTKRYFVSKKAHILLNDFILDYTQQRPATLDITDLSARARIYLLNSIINYKILYMPQYNCSSYGDFQRLSLSNAFWKKESTSYGVAEIIDLIPTTFKIGNFEYKLQQGATYYQKGSGRLYGLISSDVAEKYEQLIPHLLKLGEEKIKNFSALLLNQKKDGRVINTNNINDDKFFNGFNLLLDYEVARRLTKDDKYGDLPIISYIEFIIKNLHDKEKSIKYMIAEESSLFKGNNRSEKAKNLIPELDSTQNSEKHIRASLQYLHQSDEDSADEYIGNNENVLNLKRLDSISTSQEEEEEEEIKLLNNLTDDQIEHIKTLGGEEILLWWDAHMKEFCFDIQKSYSSAFFEISEQYTQGEFSEEQLKEKFLDVVNFGFYLS